LKNLKALRQFKNPFDTVQSLDNVITNERQAVPRETNSDSSFERNELLFENDMKSDSKRGWEDVALSWRRINPKRALEVVNRLWNSPAIRRQYIHYLRNGKRSKEVMENIPVQSDNVDPTWMIDEVGYYPADYPDSQNDAQYDDQVPKEFANEGKRGWEDIEHLRKRGWEDIAHLGKREWEDIEHLGKRGWEDIAHLGKRGWEDIEHLGKRGWEDIEHLGKRGWEDIAHLLGKKRRSENSFSSYGKRGWEPINLKRTFSQEQKYRNNEAVLNKILKQLSKPQGRRESELLDSESNITKSNRLRNDYDNIVATVATQDHPHWLRNVLETEM